MALRKHMPARRWWLLLIAPTLLLVAMLAANSGSASSLPVQSPKPALERSEGSNVRSSSHSFIAFEVSASAPLTTPTLPPLTVTPTRTPSAIPTCGLNTAYTLTSSTGASIVPGTALVAGSQVDDAVVSIALPFGYYLYGQQFLSVRADTNGNLQFTGGSTALFNSCLPASGWTNFVAPHWDNLDMRSSISATLGIYTSTSGSAPTRIFNIEWRACLWNNGSCGGYVNFEVRLYEGAFLGEARFDFVYDSVAGGGSGATVGVQSSFSTSSTQYSCNTASLSPGLLLSFQQSNCTNSPFTATPTRTPTPTITATPTSPTAGTATQTGTPTCCPGLDGNATASCSFQPGGLRDIPYFVTVNNPCPYPVNATHFIYLEVSTDGVNFNFISRTSAENVVFQPGDNYISGTFTNQSVDASVQYYRIRAWILPFTPCTNFNIYSPAYAICGPTSTPTATYTPTDSSTYTSTPTSTSSFTNTPVGTTTHAPSCTFSPTPTGTLPTYTPTVTPTRTGTPPPWTPGACSPPVQEGFESGTLGVFSSSGSPGWSAVSTSSYSGAYSAFAFDTDNVSDQRLVTTNPIFISYFAAGAQVSFWHKYDFDTVGLSAYDGGVLEASTDGGATWTDVPSFSSGGYTHTIVGCPNQNPLAGRRAWSGDSSGWVQVTASLWSLRNHWVVLRFRLGTSESNGGVGWWIDDFIVTIYEVSCYTLTPTDTPLNLPTSTPTSTPVIIGHVTWQGRPAQPHPLQQLPITMTLRPSGGGTAAEYTGLTSDASGFFTVSVGSLPNGSYNWRVKDPKYLANGGTVELTGSQVGKLKGSDINLPTFQLSNLPTVALEMGLMKAGDCDNNNVVNATDFSILKTSFGKSVGDPGYDDRADLTGDQVVNVTDFNYLRNNFGIGGAPPVGLAGSHVGRLAGQ